jgi:hypothetical protein
VQCHLRSVIRMKISSPAWLILGSADSELERSEPIAPGNDAQTSESAASMMFVEHRVRTAHAITLMSAGCGGAALCCLAARPSDGSHAIKCMGWWASDFAIRWRVVRLRYAPSKHGSWCRTSRKRRRKQAPPRWHWWCRANLEPMLRPAKVTLRNGWYTPAPLGRDVPW